MIDRMDNALFVGVLFGALALLLMALGALLAWRYRAAARHSGIGRRFPRWQGLLGSLGDLLMLLGACCLLVAGLLVFGGR